MDEHFTHPLVNVGVPGNGRNLIQRQFQKPHFPLLRRNLATAEVDLLLGCGRLTSDFPDELGVRRQSVLTYAHARPLILYGRLWPRLIPTDIPFRGRRLEPPS